MNVSGNLGTYAPGDVFRIERHAGNIEYYWNGVLKRTVSDPQPNDPMIIDFAMYEIGRSIYGLSIHNETTSVAYTADVVSYSDYYPYGMLMPGRHGSEATDKYRYGFQGQEMDDEIKGEGNSLNYEYRMHDPRVGRFFAVDPLASKYPHYTPYSFSGNEVLNKIELEGLEPIRPIYLNYDPNDGYGFAWSFIKMETSNKSTSGFAMKSVATAYSITWLNAGWLWDYESVEPILANATWIEYKGVYYNATGLENEITSPNDLVGLDTWDEYWAKISTITQMTDALAIGILLRSGFKNVKQDMNAFKMRLYSGSPNAKMSQAHYG